MEKPETKAAGEWRWRLVGLSGKLLVDLLFKTTRIEKIGIEKIESILKSRRFIFALWHSRILLISYLYQGWNGTMLVSQSRDGEWIARILQRQGHDPVRGSTTRGGLRALSQIIRRLKAKTSPAVITPDGPQGPRFKVQSGIITLAQRTGYPIVPVSFSARRVKIFNSWDRFLLPLPFTHCRVLYGEPIWVPEDADPETLSDCRLQLEKELCRITREVDLFYGHRIA